METPPERRRRLLTGEPIQSRIILQMAAPLLVLLSFLVMILGGFCARLSDEAARAETALPSLLPIFLTAAVFILAAAGVLFWTATRVSNHIVGPTARIEQTLLAVRDGDFSRRIRVRGNDLVPVVDALNDFLEWLECNRQSEPPPDDVPAQPSELTSLSSSRT